MRPQGKALGIKAIVQHLTGRKILHRGAAWTIQTVQKILASPTYIGAYYFNRHDTRAGKRRPPSEWVKTDIPGIIDGDTFDKVRQLREERSPAKMPPKRVNNPTLLTDASCGAAAAGRR
jgi:site-specific DNA recombinase